MHHTPEVTHSAAQPLREPRMQADKLSCEQNQPQEMALSSYVLHYFTFVVSILLHKHIAHEVLLHESLYIAFPGAEENLQFQDDGENGDANQEKQKGMQKLMGVH